MERIQISNFTRKTVVATRVEVASTSATRRRGLLGRAGLDPGEGLWIVPCESVHTIGMRFPIDVIYLDRQKVVKKVRRNLRPGRMSACFSAYSTIELAAGSAPESLITKGDTLEFSPVSTHSGSAAIY